jgi:hypothetical protein
MKRNSDPHNLCPVWDLTSDELERFYRGAGKATVVLDRADNIIACYYHAYDGVPEEDDTPQGYLKKVYPLATKQLEGMMSACQFCEEK